MDPCGTPAFKLDHVLKLLLNFVRCYCRRRRRRRRTVQDSALVYVTIDQLVAIHKIS